MNRIWSLPRRLLALAFAASCVVAQDALGFGRMWTLDGPPLERFAREYDFRPDPTWFEAVRLASLRFDYGCSASFVSPHGLILTNHHCVRAAMQQIEIGRDLVVDGFVAATWADELPLAGVEVQQLVAVRDVTDRIEAGVTADDDDRAARDKRMQNRERLLAEAGIAAPDLRSEVVAMYHGARHHLYQHRVITDVRLVMAPHFRVSHFGGDPDNFAYPRYSLDFAFCRAYHGGAPLDTSATHFAFGDGPQEGQPVFLLGSPGRTHRLQSTAQLEHLRDVRYPRVVERIDRRLATVRASVAGDAAREARLRLVLLNLENGQKLYRGELEALRDPSLLAQKLTGERDLLARIQADEELAREFGDVFDRLRTIAAERRATELRFVSYSHGGHLPLQRALALVAWARTGDRAALDAAPRKRMVDDPLLDRAFFVDHLESARQHLPKDDPYLAIVLGDLTPSAAVERLLPSRLHDAAGIEAFAMSSQEDVLRSSDPLLQLARELHPWIESTRREAEDLELRERAALRDYGRAVFAVWGSAVAADATMTLRIGDGRVQGYAKDGRAVPWRTLMKGLYARSAEFEGKPPFDLPTAFVDAESRFEPSTPVAFVCTCDAAGGSSGSAVIDRNRRLVGVLFDGNLESLGNEFLFRDDVQRSVCVHVGAITATLEHAYGARSLLAELLRKPNDGR